MLPILAMLGAVALWSSLVVITKHLLELMAISEVLAIRLVLGAALLWLLVLLLRAPAHWRRVDRRILFMGLLEPGLVSVLVIYGLAQSTAITAAVLWSLMPLVMPLLGRLVLREPVQISVLVAALLAFAGTAMLTWGQTEAGGGTYLGAVLIVCGILCACINQLVARRVAVTGGHPLVTTTYQISAATLVGLFVFLVIERPEMGVMNLETGDGALLAYLAVAGGAGPFLLYNFALRSMPVGRISLFVPLIGPAGAGMAALFLGEALSTLDLAAIALVLFAAFLPNLTGLVRRPVQG